ncbi:class I SAM-dependent methyltransferase [Psychrobacter sp. N25K4-3-2]|uniref:O-methyltransferase n=1 Tax=Psychrobacter sp. N25K4-3-2 TaxID=2785026 RepID=UPI00188D4BB0|nr:class I SAM-dependent methyltransferase [Psychrobacter sp. N25K4-3-2]MBF4489685.1 class I SAM-dependent methyltransferase [Psychrobacter sp. N25K4-3-2]
MSMHKGFERTYFLSYCQSLYDTEQANRLNRHRHVEPDSAKFLASIAMIREPHKVLEIGTSTGFSTLWLAYGLRHQSNVDFISLDIDKSRSNTAKQHLQNVGLSSLVRFIVQDAFVFLSKTEDVFDLVFLDAERQFYSNYTERLHKVLSVGNVLIVDNVLSHSDEVCEFLAEFINNPRYICHTLDIGAGLFMAVRQEP